MRARLYQVFKALLWSAFLWLAGAFISSWIVHTLAGLAAFYLGGGYAKEGLSLFEALLRTSLMVPAVAVVRCGIGFGGLVQGIIEWLENLFSAPSPQPAPAQEETPKKQKRAA